MKCKNCGTTLISDKRMLGEFCSEDCFWKYSGEADVSRETLDKVQFIEEKEVTASVNVQLHFDCIKKIVVIKDRSYLISNKTLQPYLSYKPFDKFLNKYRLMVVKLDNEMSVIKKSIL
jgi:hypothetical protein